MTRIYKLTDENMQTHNGFQWALNTPVPRLSGEGELCTDRHYHAYTSPLQAVLLNPMGSDFHEKTMRLFIGDGEISKLQYDKCGCHTITLKREIPVPDFPIVARVRVAILLAKCVYKEQKWTRWADEWLDGSDRSAARAVRAAWAVRAVRAAWAARAARAASEAWAAWATSAAWAAGAASAVRAAWAAGAASAVWAASIILPNLHRLCREAIKAEVTQ